ncbi:hypothetical protein, partial [Anaplasma phagocytophilum]|uniref:hypothetical protein n=1 Tax=Anaplasma phagocytophilum TaxID=948 RepID=UPI001C401EE8
RSVVDLIYINPDAELSPSTMQHIQPSCFAALPSFKPYHTSHGRCYILPMHTFQYYLRYCCI